MPPAEFDLRALYRALDEARQSRKLSWAAATREINRDQATGHPLATSSITGLAHKSVAEGDGVLQMLLWLVRTPESFIPGSLDAAAERYRLEHVAPSEILRWDSSALHAALDARRRERGMTWTEVARELRGYTPAILANLAEGGRVGFPGVMRLVGWLDQPAASFTRVLDRGRRA